jgi:hypothetical protein
MVADRPVLSKKKLPSLPNPTAKSTGSPASSVTKTSKNDGTLKLFMLKLASGTPFAVSMRDIIMRPGSKTAGPPMPNAMVCHIHEGEMRIDQEGKTFTPKKNFCWTCNKETKEQAFNDGSVVAIMRITDLMA